jgi:outer membrane protein assembly factor BamB
MTRGRSPNVAWKTAIPGLAHSRPIVWNDRIYVTTAVAESGKPSVVTRDAGIASAGDIVRHTWRLLAMDKASGRIAWDRAVHSGIPRMKRHVKSSHASATPATDGRVIVALLDSEGLFCFEMNGTLKWRQDLGVMDVGLYDGILYVCTDNGILSAYDPATGTRIYQQRVSAAAGGFSASPIAVAGRIYLASEKVAHHQVSSWIWSRS